MPGQSSQFCFAKKYSRLRCLTVIFSLLFLSVLTQTLGASAAQVTLSWDAPTTNADGTPLTDLGGFKVYYGTASRAYTEVVDVRRVTTVTVPDLIDGPVYYFAVTAYDMAGNESGYSNEVKKNTVTPAVAAGSLMVRAADKWYIDFNNNGTWDGPSVDRIYTFGLAADVPVSGDFNGDGRIKIGTFRNGAWALDMNGNGAWDGPVVDKVVSFGMPGDVPVTGDWNGDGKDEIGIFRRGIWALDMNGNLAWDGPFVDHLFVFGLPSDVPVTGDWNGGGVTKIGVFRKGIWYLDLNANDKWEGCAVDRCNIFGLRNDIPVTGDWNGTGTTKMGVYRNGLWMLDFNGNGRWDAQPADEVVSAFTPL